jgi:hypothetical protein
LKLNIMPLPRQNQKAACAVDMERVVHRVVAGHLVEYFMPPGNQRARINAGLTAPSAVAPRRQPADVRES